MREAKQDTRPETMGNDFTSSDGLANIVETCLSGRKSSSTRKRQDLVRTPAALWIDGVLLPLLSLAGVLNLLGVTSFGWNAYAEAFGIILLLSFVPECFGRTYLTHKDGA
jgi:hypothetical protein